MAVPLRRCHATLISLPTPESVSANVDLPPAPTQAASSTAPIIPPILPVPAPSAPGASSSTRKKQRKQSKRAKKVASPPPPAELSVPLPVPYACSNACGPRLCEWYAKDRPPIGHQNPIPNFIVSTIIRHAVLHRFGSPEEIKEREIATGVADRPKDRELGERDVDDVEYGLSGDFKPPAWALVKARLRKSCFRKRESARFSPYPNPSTRTPLIRRSTEDIKASFGEALADRIQLRYEAIAIRNEISAIHIPNEEPFKWEPQYAGPPSEALRDVHNSRSGITLDTVPSSTSGLASSMQEDLEDEAAVVELLIRNGSKKRRYTEDDDTTIDSTIKALDGPPTTKSRTNPSAPPSSTPPPPSSTPPPPPSPIRSTSRSGTSTAVATNSSSSDGEFSQWPPRKERVVKKKLRFLSSDPFSTHPKFGTQDSMYLHHRRLTSNSKNLRNTKKHPSSISSHDWNLSLDCYYGTVNPCVPERGPTGWWSAPRDQQEREAPEAGRLDLRPEQRSGWELGRARGVAPGWQPGLRAALGQAHEPPGLGASADAREGGGHD